jgi:hypothetical protein
MTCPVQGLLSLIAIRRNMSVARYILVALICSSPVTLLWDGLVMQGLIAGIVAIALAIMVQTLRPGETKFLVSTIRPAAAAAAVPALWVLIQVLPLRAIAHPIWRSLETALGRPVTGSISVDPGASIIALGQYLSMIAICFVSAAVAVDRRRAEWVLWALTGGSAAIALILLICQLFYSGGGPIIFSRAEAIDCSGIGTIIAAAACIRTLERYETRHASPLLSLPILLYAFAASSAALAICVLALVVAGTREVLAASGCGITAFACVTIIRRFQLGAWYATAIAAPVISVLVLIVAAHPTEHERSLLLAFAAPPTAASERVLGDAPLVGTGAGTFAALAPIYREIDDPPFRSIASTAAAFAIGLGKPMLFLIATATTVAIIALLRASLQRGRDSFYPAMGGSCLVTLLLLAFVNAGLLATPVSLIAAATLGLAVAQSKSRTVRPYAF